MKISLENYIIFIVDYFDNVLSPSEQNELFEFLELHPALKEEFESFGQSKRMSLPEQHISNDFKYQLKKIAAEPIGKVSRDNIETYLAKEIEGALSQVEKIELADFIKHNPLFLRDRNLYKLTKVEADEDIMLSKLYKQTLKKIATITSAGIHMDNIDEWLILYCERELTLSQEKDLLAFIALNPVYQTDLELYKHTYLSPDKKIVFKDKKKLYIKGIQPLYIKLMPYLSATVAACLVVYFSYNSTIQVQPTEKLAAPKVDITPTMPSVPHYNNTEEQTAPVGNVIASFATMGGTQNTRHRNTTRNTNNSTHADAVMLAANTISASADTNKPVEFNVVRLEDASRSEEDMALENRIKQRLIEQELMQGSDMNDKMVQVSGGNTKVNWDEVAKRASNWVNRNTRFRVNMSRNVPQNVNGKPVIIGNTVLMGGF